MKNPLKFIFNNLFPELTEEEHELFFAAKTNDAKKIDELSVSGVNINAKNFFSVRATHFAASNGCKEALSALFKNGADFSLKDIIGDTPLKNAILQNDKDTENFIIELLDSSRHI